MGASREGLVFKNSFFRTGSYDRSAIEGLTAEDLMQSIAAKYGPPIDPVTEIDLSTGERRGGPEETAVAHWEDAKYSPI